MVQGKTDFYHGVRSLVYINDKPMGVANGVSFAERSQKVDSAYVMGSLYSQANRAHEKIVIGTIRTFVADFGDELYTTNRYKIRTELLPPSFENGIRVVGDIGSMTSDHGLMGRIRNFDLKVSIVNSKNTSPVGINGIDSTLGATFEYTDVVIKDCKITNMLFEVDNGKYWQRNVEFIGKIIDHSTHLDHQLR